MSFRWPSVTDEGHTFQFFKLLNIFGTNENAKADRRWINKKLGCHREIAVRLHCVVCQR